MLEPRWVTNAVYKIINSKQLANSNGVLELDLLGDILKQETDADYSYPRDKYRFIIDLMMKFKLCYEISSNTILIPDLLEFQEPAINFNDAQSLKFLITYDFLPKSVMPRFIVNMHKDIKDNLRWRTGVVLEDKGLRTTAIVKADERDKKVYITVNGEQRRDYFSVIRKALREINESFEKLEFIELVPLPDNHSVTVEYEELIGLERMGKLTITIGKLRKEYPVKQLLNGIEREIERIERREHDFDKPIPETLRNLLFNLVDILVKEVSATDSFVGRNALLMHIPGIANLNRDPSNARTDIILLIQQLWDRNEAFSPNHPLYILIENSLGYVGENTPIGQDLLQLRSTLELTYQEE